MFEPTAALAPDLFGASGALEDFSPMTEPSYRRHPDLRLTPLEGEGIVLHLGERRYFSVSETGLALLEALKQSRTFQELVEGLLAEQGVERETAISTTRAFLDQCLASAVVMETRG